MSSASSPATPSRKPRRSKSAPSSTNTGSPLPKQKRTQHIWWTRQDLGTYAPTLAHLSDGSYAIAAAPDLNGPPAP